MINWVDKSDRGSRFYLGELPATDRFSANDAARAIFAFMREKILGEGTAEEFELLMFEVNCDTGRLIAGASTESGWKINHTDGCSIRVQELQDHWYDLIEAGIAPAEFSELIRHKVIEVANTFRKLVVVAADELRAKAKHGSFKLVVYGNDRGKAVLDETFA